jgi:hypothetical protein
MTKIRPPIRAATRPSRRLAAPSFAPTSPLLQQTLASWARPPKEPAVGADAAFRARASLALLDQILRADPPFAGAPRQRLALRAATACASMARLREDASGLRDAEHFSPDAGGGDARTSRAGRIHRLWRGFAGRPAGFEPQHLRRAADLLELPRDLDLEALAETLRRLVQDEKNPLAAATRAGSTAMRMLDGASRVEAEILALWLSDLVLARRLDWERPIPLLATTLAHPGLRSVSFGGACNSRAADVSSGAGNIRAAPGRRPRPDGLEWPLYCAKAYAPAARDAHGLAGELSRRSERLLSVAPKLRVKGAGRVIKMLLDDDAVTPATASKTSGLSDRASRRLFDRLVELGTVREPSGRPSFRLYGL